MRPRYKIAERYVPGRLEKLQKLERVHLDLTEHIGTLQYGIFSDILDGWTTGVPAHDFALVASGGAYDEALMRGQYGGLEERLWLNDGKRLLVVQTAMYVDDKHRIPLHNIYLARSRLDVVEYDIGRMLIGIPVAQPYLVYREMLNKGRLSSVHAHIPAEMIYVGPLYNALCDIGKTQRSADGKTFCTSSGAVSFIYTEPWNLATLHTTHGIDEDMVRFLMTRYLHVTQPL